MCQSVCIFVVSVCVCVSLFAVFSDGKLIEQTEMKQQIKYLANSKVRRCCNCFQYLFSALLQFGAMTSVFLVVVVALNFKISKRKSGKQNVCERKRKKRNEIHTNNCENGIECFKMAEEFRNAERKRTLLNKTKIVCRRNGMCQRSQYKTSARRQSFYLSNSFFRLLFCVGCWRVFHSLSLCVCVFRNFLDCLFSIGST